MIEVEMKFRCEDWSRILDLLSDIGASLHANRIETDHYFAAPDRDFAQTDEALRLRCIGEENTFTYKGPKIDTETKSRLEIELPLVQGEENAAQARRFLQALGYRPVAVVTKSRQIYHFDRDGYQVAICLDDVARVGKFLEIETIAAEADFAGARRLVLQVAGELRLTEPERRSYLRMTLEQAASGV